MKTKIRRTLLAIVATLTLAAPALAPAAVYAQQPNIENGLCQGANLQATPGQTANCDVGGDAAVSKVNGTITLIINIFSLIVGVASVVMIIIGGLRYIISGGDSGNVTAAKNTILYAIIGLVVVALSQFIVKFVLTKLTSSPTT